MKTADMPRIGGCGHECDCPSHAAHTESALDSMRSFTPPLEYARVAASWRAAAADQDAEVIQDAIEAVEARLADWRWKTDDGEGRAVIAPLDAVRVLVNVARRASHVTR